MIYIDLCNACWSLTPKESILNIDQNNNIIWCISTRMYLSPQGCHSTWHIAQWMMTYVQSLGPKLSQQFQMLMWWNLVLIGLSYQLILAKICNNATSMHIIWFTYLFAWGMDFSGSYRDAWDFYQILHCMLDHLAVHGYGWIEARVEDLWTGSWEILINLQFLKATWI